MPEEILSTGWGTRRSSPTCTTRSAGTTGRTRPRSTGGRSPAGTSRSPGAGALRRARAAIALDDFLHAFRIGRAARPGRRCSSTPATRPPGTRRRWRVRTRAMRYASRHRLHARLPGVCWSTSSTWSRTPTGSGATCPFTCSPASCRRTGARSLRPSRNGPSERSSALAASAMPVTAHPGRAARRGRGMVRPGCPTGRAWWCGGGTSWCRRRAALAHPRGGRGRRVGAAAGDPAAAADQRRPARGRGRHGGGRDRRSRRGQTQEASAALADVGTDGGRSRCRSVPVRLPDTIAKGGAAAG